MQKRKLGTSALEVSAVGLGGNNFGGRIDFEASQQVVHRAIDLGINLIDTADTYGNKGGSEEWLGRILGDKRKQIVLATKFGLPMDDAGKLEGASRRYVMQAVEASLKRLRTDWIDLYQLHRPDAQTPIEETLRALDDLVRAGQGPLHRLLEPAGAAGHRGARDGAAARPRRLRIVPGRVQPAGARHRARAHSGGEGARHGRAALFPARQRPAHGQIPARRAAAAGHAYGEAPAPRRRLHTERNWRIVGALEEFAARRGRSMLELAFSWLLRDGVVASVIAGATSPAQVEQNIRAAAWVLTAEDLAEIDRITL